MEQKGLKGERVKRLLIHGITEREEEVKKIGLSKALMQGNLIAVAYTLRTY